MNKTWIFIPGAKEKFLDKAKELKADVLIFDLEDSVVPKDKKEARGMVKAALGQPASKNRRFVRVNDVHSPFFIDDIATLTDAVPDGIVIPKVDTRDEMMIADFLLSHYERENDLPSGSIRIVPLIETGRGIINAAEIAQSNERIEALAFGAEDYMLDVSIPKDEGDALLYARSVLVTASSAAGIAPPIDSVYTDFNDPEGLKAASIRSRGTGFQGRLVIHPKQLETINEVFGPTAREIEEARKIVEAYETSFNEGDGALQVNGKMIDAPVAERAKKLLENESVY
ncbi:HpcH/HpaI aldolase/citrate lyase family protein [Salinicoccus luteus]|uniref:HpcH/HpaI aldolase/citrate lyase family protein n=1 Tax=Salinicoccus luteus TaxID=367840 RepID=UPI0004E2474C|nr:CoA ester lyase [Salinicoccus luteus]